MDDSRWKLSVLKIVGLMMIFSAQICFGDTDPRDICNSQGWPEPEFRPPMSEIVQSLHTHPKYHPNFLINSLIFNFKSRSTQVRNLTID
ncbi:hypothetical protein HanIR_Chr04g0201951 [Helianthus annuus]|nr:hypothetical protein HanIR_Chr04g0201951 [Helianthus annuus]